MLSKLKFQITTALGAFLLFLVEPFLAKFITPIVGGSFSVWSATIAFFTLALFLGYVYAYSILRLSKKWQIGVHCTLVLLSLGSLFSGYLLWGLPLLPTINFLPIQSWTPFLSVFVLLSCSILIPFILLSSTTILLQHWQSSIKEIEANPYRLYSISNIASFVALGSFPFLFELFMPMSTLSFFWSGFFILYVVCLLLAVRTFAKKAVTIEAPSEDSNENHPTTKLILRWLAYSALGTWILVSVTTSLNQEISGFPLLSIIPLALYLLTFVIVFRGISFPSVLAPIIILSILLTLPIDIHLWTAIVLSLLAFLFFACFFLHEAIYKTRPTIKYLPTFYLVVAGGGALGSFLGSIAAPLIFPDLYETFIGMLLVMLLIIPTLKGLMMSTVFNNRKSGAFKALLIFVYSIIIVSFIFTKFGKNSEVPTRTFYGIYKIYETKEDSGSMRKLISGDIIHGSQFTDVARSALPTTYYSQKSGVGIALLNIHQNPKSVGVVGLGTGTMSAYCGSNDRFRFYEIDPAVALIARSKFTFISDCENRSGVVEIIIGDARQSLEKEKGNNFDMLIVDAFTDDAIPTHLLTQESFITYKKHLKDTGVLAIHISNKHLNLEPIVLGGAKSIGYSARVIKYKQPSPEESKLGATGSNWVILGSEAFLSEAFPNTTYPTALIGDPWTDDKNSILPAFLEKMKW